VAAAHAACVVHDYGAVYLLIGGLDRTDGDAGRVVTVVAQAGEHVHAGLFPVADLVSRDDGAETVFRNLILHDASDSAGLAADALADVDYHCPPMLGSFSRAGGGCALASEGRQSDGD